MRISLGLNVGTLNVLHISLQEGVLAEHQLEFLSSSFSLSADERGSAANLPSSLRVRRGLSFAVFLAT